MNIYRFEKPEIAKEPEVFFLRRRLLSPMPIRIAFSPYLKSLFVLVLIL
jgi:hypothetical protein